MLPINVKFHDIYKEVKYCKIIQMKIYNSILSMKKLYMETANWKIRSQGFM